MAWFPPGVDGTAGNDVTAYTSCADYYGAVAAEVNAAQAGATVILAGWTLDLGTPAGGGKIGDLLAAAAGRGVLVRVLLSGHLTNRNTNAAGWLGQHGVAAIVDRRLPPAGAYHQKIVAVDGKVAFVGGMDFGAERLGDGGHGPWHDVQLQLRGPAAFEVYDRCVRRWNGHPNGLRQPLPPRLRPGPRRQSDPPRLVRIAGTFAATPTGEAVNREVAAAAGLLPVVQPPALMPVGEHGIHDLLLHGVRTATRSIYVEDQFFTGVPDVVQALVDTVAKPTFEHLVILTARAQHAQTDLQQVNRHRREVLRRLTAVFPAKVSAWVYRDGQTRCGWMHAKTWIFDDELAVVGSANFNRRGLTHDGEIAAGVVDPPWVADLRRTLWAKHLGFPAPGFAGFTAAATSPGSVLERLDVDADDRAFPDRLLACGRPSGTLLSLLQQHLMCRYLPLLGIRTNTFPLQWDSIIDPDGS